MLTSAKEIMFWDLNHAEANELGKSNRLIAALQSYEQQEK